MNKQPKNQNDISTYLIMGYPRSGTTWFANLFNTHPDVVYRHEVIGRCHLDFPDTLFKKLKYDNKLTDEDYDDAIKIILSPNIESDRAPFFKKNYLLLKNPQFHYISWLTTKTVPLFKSIYKFIFKPRSHKLTLVIKETRSSKNMGSIIEGIRSKKNIILFRHPCGAIASSLVGIESGKMPSTSSTNKEKWFHENRNREYIQNLNLTNSQIKSLPEHEYLALWWRLQNEDYLDFPNENRQNIFINYENFMLNQETETKKLFSKMSLSYDPSVDLFLKVSSGKDSSKPILKDSSSSFYSVYRSKDFNPEKWKKTLSERQITGIEKHTTDIFKKLLDLSTK